MKKTKFEKIKEQQKKARNKEILYRVKQILLYDNKEATNTLEDVVVDLHSCYRILPGTMAKYLKPWYKLVELSTGKEIKPNE